MRFNYTTNDILTTTYTSLLNISESFSETN